jgi:hypothetical protein
MKSDTLSWIPCRSKCIDYFGEPQIWGPAVCRVGLF